MTLISACQPVPRPFQPDSKRLNAADFARLGTRGGIIVRVPVLKNRATAERLAGLVAAALRDVDVPAIAGPHDETNRYVLIGRADISAAVGTDVALAGVWRLVDPQNKEIKTFQVAQQLDAAGWRSGDTATLALFAESVAQETAKQIAGVRSPAPRSSLAPQRIAVWPIGGLSGEQASRLEAAVMAALRTRGLIVVGVDDPTALVVTGWVKRTAVGAATERISVDWALLRRDGQEVGVVSQSNVIPTGELDLTWPDAAPAIAGAAAEGLVEMLSRLPNPDS
ncbi:MAG: hypothetical protein HQ495_16055 [Alphaproteobacteria bacterium]|nr:hypothetical protein [Alphaproteobacteria bacterium]